jgi:uncharacterized phage protein gp47/JayE
LSFQTKALTSIVASIINHARATQSQLTDFTIGSVARTMLESPAIEIEQAYIQFFNGLLEAIPTAIYTSFNFPLLPAQNANGLINVVIEAQSTDTLIAANTVFQLAGTGLKFFNPADVVITAGNTTASVNVAAQVAGASGNVAGASTFTMLPQVNGFVSATAAADFSGGKEVETEDQRKARFTAFIASLARSTTAAIEYVLGNLIVLYDPSGLETERVSTWYIDEQWLRDNTLPRALVDIYIFNGVSGASGALVQRTLDVINGYVDSTGSKVAGYKAAGVHFNVYPATISRQNVAASIVVAPGFDVPTVEAAANAAVASYLLALPIGKTAFPEAMSAAAAEVPGVVSYKVTTPSAPVTPALGVKLLAGTFTTTQDTTPYAL